jgi:hypothetical protein
VNAAVIAPVIEPVHVNGNDTVIVIDTVDDATGGSRCRCQPNWLSCQTLDVDAEN